MAQNRTNADYGAVFVDQSVVQDPTSELGALYYDRLAEDSAQLTRTAGKVDVKFATTTDAAPASVAVVSSQTQWGTGAFYQPTIQKTATGTYTITYASSYADGLVGTSADEIGETETVALEYPRGHVLANSDAIVRCTVSSNVITVYVRISGALSDLGGGVTIWVEAK